MGQQIRQGGGLLARGSEIRARRQIRREDLANRTEGGVGVSFHRHTHD
ncbi:hypothetical protein ABZV91_18320 [Nocardia sp. NPDC004568]